MADLSLEDACAFAADLASEASSIARAMFGDVSIERKADRSYVTAADRRIQRVIADAIASRYPNHAFLGEERVEHDPPLPAPGESEFCWIVDPIDGTRNFAHGFPVTATAIALMRDGRPVVGVVQDHHSGWRCTAIAGHGVTCNGNPQCVSERPLGRDTVIAVPTGRNDEPILPIIKKWVDQYVLRNVGSTALHMAYLASGAVDAVLCYECKLWDVAGGDLMVNEAGGRCVNLNGSARHLPNPEEYRGGELSFFAASPTVFDALRSEIEG